MSVITLFTQGIPQPVSPAFSVGTTPVTLSVFGLPVGETILIEEFLQKDTSRTTGSNCCLAIVGGVVDVASKTYQIGTCTPRIVGGTNSSIVIDKVGLYRVILPNPAIGLVDMIASDESAYDSITDEMRGCFCLDTTWSWTGESRCNGSNVEHQEISNCGILRWVVFGAVSWTATGEQRCEGLNVEYEEVNDCGVTRWVINRLQTWTRTGETQCTNTFTQYQESNDCGALRWVDGEPTVWIDTGKTRCESHLIEREQANACGALRWAVTVEKCGYCASLPLPSGGYAYQLGDEIDPAATVALTSGLDIIGWIYPTPTAGASTAVLVTDDTTAVCDDCVADVVLGYASNTSNCAPDNDNCDCPC